jgi:hypothetical protein
VSDGISIACFKRLYQTPSERRFEARNDLLEHIHDPYARAVLVMHKAALHRSFKSLRIAVGAHRQ